MSDTSVLFIDLQAWIDLLFDAIRSPIGDTRALEAIEIMRGDSCPVKGVEP